MDINATNFAQEARTETAEGRHQNYMGGTEAARGLLNRQDNFGDTLGGGPDGALKAAIRSKYAGNFERAQDRLNFDMLKNAKSDHLKKLEVATQMAEQEHAMNFEKEMQRKKMAQAKQAMRAQLVGSVLGIVGGVSGAAISGSPTGMLAGQALGQGVGTAVGGGMG